MAITNANTLGQMKSKNYDIDLNIPPVFNP